MTEVLARAREFVKAIPQLDAVAKQVQDPSQGFSTSNQGGDSILVLFRDEDRRLESFSAHGGWKLERPNPKDLAQAGFFFAPLPACEDRVACYACGKVLFNWDPNDNIADAHKLFSPNCPLVTGKPIEIPSAVKKVEPATWATKAAEKSEDKGLGPLANLSSFVENLQKTAGPSEAEDIVITKASKKAAKKAKKQGNEGSFPSAALVASTSASDADNTASDGDGDSQIKSKVQAVPQMPAGAKNRSERLWNFDWSVPTAIRNGLKGDNGILEAQTSELEMRLATAKKLMTDKKDDWTCADLHAAAVCKNMEQECHEKLNTVDKKLDSFKGKMEKISNGVKLLTDDSFLAKRAKELKDLKSETDELQRVRAEHQSELENLREQTAAEKEDLEIIKNKQRLTAELDAKLAEQKALVIDLEQKAEAAYEAAEQAKEDKQRMEQSMIQVRDELRDEISELHQEKLSHEGSLAEMTEQMLRVKKLYTEYKSRLDELQRREAQCDSRESDSRAKEEHLARRENTLKTREEWMAKREAEFRIQQRALENAQFLPKGYLEQAAGKTPSHGTGSGSEGKANREDSSGALAAVPLADQVQAAQAQYSARPQQPLGAAAQKGKSGAKDLTQRDYKAILSTSEKTDPKQEREAAKAARRRDMLTSIIPKALRKGDKSKDKAQAPAGGFFDMNSI